MIAVCRVFYSTGAKDSAGATLSSYLSVPLQLCVVSVLPEMCPFALTWPFCLCTMFYLILVERPEPVVADKDSTGLSEPFEVELSETPAGVAARELSETRAGVAAEDHDVVSNPV